MTRRSRIPSFLSVALLLSLSIVAPGCRPVVVVPPEPEPTPTQPWKAEAAYLPEVTQAWQSVNGPITPDVTSDKCPNCNGTGRVGDTRTEKTCPECNGTGKKTTRSAAIAPTNECET